MLMVLFVSSGPSMDNGGKMVDMGPLNNVGNMIRSEFLTWCILFEISLTSVQRQSGLVQLHASKL